jgi:endonuclease/exonuclease/phosphatase family metal-dependent hydrolase
LLEALAKEKHRLVIVLGDFNEWTPRNHRVKSLCTHLGKCPTLRTFPSLYPVLALDRIWVRPVESITDICVHDTPMARIASDHLPLRATIAMSNGLQRPRREVVLG